MKTVISTDRNAAVELLRAGEIVALPTETVYGLAADALSSMAVLKIFEAKERPRFDPLIVHVTGLMQLEGLVEIPKKDWNFISSLAKAFWPGPFTMVLRRRAFISEIATAGLETVAVRVSAHPVFSEVLRQFGKPLAAPSANRFGRVSPTTAQHVFEELSGRVPLIIDAGPTTHGLESTIVAIRDCKISILRRGPITSEQLSEFGKVDIATESEKPVGPGQLPSHYAPRTPLQLVDDLMSYNSKQRCALLAWNPIQEDERFVAIRVLSENQDIREAAANLFRYLRELDDLGVDLIVAERVPEKGLGAAILDRLQRASHA